MTDSMGELPQQPPSDPDAAAAVSDFIDYTEFFPSDLFRSLTLIGKLDATYLDSAYKIHDLTKTYGALPSLSASECPAPHELRKRISHALDRAIRSREASYAEASRIYDVADRHCNRLNSIKKKLEALPKPPSRDPTPVPVASPQLSRARKQETDRTRITLHLGTSSRSGTSAGQLKRSRKITVPGEVLPPPNPDSPPLSTASEYESEPPGSPDDAGSGSANVPSQSQRIVKPSRIKVPKLPKHKIKLPTGPRQRPPGVMGTNVHSVVAGISTSNALAKLDPPPSDAKPGSKFMPWNRLTEYEMAKLRKRMKKNAIWTPSDTMVRRELADLGRGKENYDKAKAHAEATGEPFLDEEPMDPSKPLQPGEISFVPIGAQDLTLSNRGMKLNEAKKLKKEILAKEQAARDAHGTDDGLGKTVEEGKTTTTPIPDKPSKKRKPESPPADTKPDTKTESSASSTKPATNAPKRLKPSAPVPIAPHPAPPTTTTTTTTQIPLAPPAPSPKKSTTASLPKLDTGTPSRKDNKLTTGNTITTTTLAQSRPRRNSLAPAASGTTITLPMMSRSPHPTATTTRSPTIASATRPRSRGSKAMSAEPQPPSRRSTLRRSSNASLPASSSSVHQHQHQHQHHPHPPETAPVSASAGARRRAKRPTPGPVTKGGDGGSAKVSAAKRRSAPKGRKGGRGLKQEGGGGGAGGGGGGEGETRDEEMDVDGEEAIDPNEPKYCFCNRVSFGEMIGCDDKECDMEWFHFECLGLTEAPPRGKWFCPECAKKPHNQNRRKATG